MALVYWQTMDEAYEKMAKKLVKGKGADKTPTRPDQVQKSRIDAAQEWDAFIERHKGSLPAEVRELLVFLRSDNIETFKALMDFSTTVMTVWPDMRKEYMRLEGDNQALLKEKFEGMRKSIWNTPSDHTGTTP